MTYRIISLLPPTFGSLGDYTSQSEIAEILGYANHCAVAKRLARIRVAAEDFFNQS